MTNREKAIQGIDMCLHHFCYGADCPYYKKGCMDQMLIDALELLKAQEPILLENQHKPGGHFINANSPWKSKCPQCGKKIEGRRTRFCKYCGQAVKWND